MPPADQHQVIYHGTCSNFWVTLKMVCQMAASSKSWHVRAAVKRLSQAEYSNDNDLRFSLASASMKTLGKACSEKRRLDRADRVCKAADDPSEAEARAVVKIGSKQTKVRKSQMKPRHILVVVDASRNVSQRHSLFVTTSVVLPTPPSCA